MSGSFIIGRRRLQRIQFTFKEKKKIKIWKFSTPALPEFLDMGKIFQDSYENSNFFKSSYGTSSTNVVRSSHERSSHRRWSWQDQLSLRRQRALLRRNKPPDLARIQMRQMWRCLRSSSASWLRMGRSIWTIGHYSASLLKWLWNWAHCSGKDRKNHHLKNRPIL